MTSNDFFSNIGLDSIGFYAPRFYLDLLDLAKNRKIHPNKIKHGLLLKEMRFPEYGEDIVTMGLKAGYNALMRGNINPKDIDALFVGTETITYAVKSVSNILAELLNISTNSITQDIYNACAAGTLAVVNAIGLIEKGIIQKALIICADICSYEIGSPGEPTQGAGAAALVISKNPRIASFSKTFGKFSGNVNDYYRPAGEENPQVFGKYSIESYLRFQLGAFDDLNKNLGDFHADYYVFHAPFSRLPLKFIQELIIKRSDHFIKYILDSDSKAPRSRISNRIPSIRYSIRHFPSIITNAFLKRGFSRKIIEKIVNKLYKYGNSILPQLRVPMHFGNMYSASVWAQINYLLENFARPSDILYFGSYGSGATCLSGLLKVLPEAYQVVKKGPKVEDFFVKKERKTVFEYEQLKKGLIKPLINFGTIKPHTKNENKGFKLHFCDEGCLIPNFEGINYCPLGHSGFYTKFYPFHAVLSSELRFTNNKDVNFVKNNVVKILGRPNIGTTLEYGMRRTEPHSDTISMSKGLLNWSPVYIPIYYSI